VSAVTLVEITLLAMVGAVLQGSVGFGFGVFAVPFFLLIEPDLVPGPLLATAFLLTLALTHRERRGVLVGDLKWALAGRLAGIAAALWVLTIVPADHLTGVLGALVLVAVALAASGLRVEPGPTSLLGAGALSGFMSTTVSAGGPAIALLYQDESGERMRGTLSAYFMLGIVLSLIGLHFVHRFGTHELVLAALLLPGTAIGYLLSRRVARVLDRGHTRRAVLTLSAIAGAVVVVKDLL
jgi:uncharacterized membrane protein YfcA